MEPPKLSPSEQARVDSGRCPEHGLRICHDCGHDITAETRRRENLSKPTRDYPGDVAMHDIQMRYKW